MISLSLNEMRRKGPRGCTGPMDVMYVFWGATTLNPGRTPALCSIEAKTVVLFSDKTR
jgi:hypothetical protein